MSIEHMTLAQWNALPLQREAAAKKAKKASSETNIVVKPCLEWLKRHGIPAWRNNTGKTVIKDKYGKERYIAFGITGQADITGLLPPYGRRLEIECKLPGKTQSPEQKAYQRMIEAAGGVYIVAHSIDDLRILIAP